ncbi:MAG: transporter [Flavobacteriales bacterium]
MKIFILLIPILFFIPDTKSCDICGCGVGSNYMGILPQFNRNFGGIRYKDRAFKHQNTPLSLSGNNQITEDRFRTAELWARIFPGKRWQYMFFVPFSLHERKGTMYSENIHGIGDISINAHYLLINTGDSIEKNTKVTWMMGGGIQLPTGKYQQRSRNMSMFPQPFQIGRGAWAFSGQTILMLRRKKWGINTDITYRYMLQNELDYQFGPQTIAAFNAFHWSEIKQTSILSNIGIIHENYGYDKEFGFRKTLTGGNVALISTGIDVYFKKFIIGSHYFLPIKQNIPEVIPENKGRWLIQCIMFL